MRTILNIGLGLALAFCLIFLVSGEFEKYVDRRVEVALAERLGAVGEDIESNEQSNVDINEIVEKAVNKAVAKVKNEIKATAKTTTTATPAPTAVPVAAPKTTSTSAVNRQYIDVRGPKGAVKLYVGQPKDEVLELLGTPDSYNFGGSFEDCRYDLSLTSWISLDFKNGKLTKVNKY